MSSIRFEMFILEEEIVHRCSGKDDWFLRIFIIKEIYSDNITKFMLQGRQNFLVFAAKICTEILPPKFFLFPRVKIQIARLPVVSVSGAVVMGLVIRDKLGFFFILLPQSFWLDPDIFSGNNCFDVLEFL
jgi:hypothetical protein